MGVILMKKYLICWYFLDQGMEGWPSLTDAFIVEADDKESAIKKFPTDIKKRSKGWGHVTVLGEIVNDELLVEKEHYNYKNSVLYVYESAVRL